METVTFLEINWKQNTVGLNTGLKIPFSDSMHISVCQLMTVYKVMQKLVSGPEMESFN